MAIGRDHLDVLPLQNEEDPIEGVARLVVGDREARLGQHLPKRLSLEAHPRRRRCRDRKSTRLNSSHLVISYAVFCLKKKKISSAESTKLTAISDAVTRSSHHCSAHTSRTLLSKS